jgi:hypothetical protein
MKLNFKLMKYKSTSSSWAMEAQQNEMSLHRDCQVIAAAQNSPLNKCATKKFGPRILKKPPGSLILDQEWGIPELRSSRNENSTVWEVSLDLFPNKELQNNKKQPRPCYGLIVCNWLISSRGMSLIELAQSQINLISSAYHVHDLRHVINTGPTTGYFIPRHFSCPTFIIAFTVMTCIDMSSSSSSIIATLATTLRQAPVVIATQLIGADGGNPVYDFYIRINPQTVRVNHGIVIYQSLSSPFLSSPDPPAVVGRVFGFAGQVQLIIQQDCLNHEAENFAILNIPWQFTDLVCPKAFRKCCPLRFCLNLKKNYQV